MPTTAKPAQLNQAEAEPPALYMIPWSGGEMVLARQHADMANPLTLPKTSDEGVASFNKMRAQGVTMIPKKLCRIIAA